jgi:hypothetical protein
LERTIGSRPRLVDGDLSGAQALDLGGVDVDAGDVVAHFSKTGAGDQADVAGADDGQVHGEIS